MLLYENKVNCCYNCCKGLHDVTWEVSSQWERGESSAVYTVYTLVLGYLTFSIVCFTCGDY